MWQGTLEASPLELHTHRQTDKPIFTVSLLSCDWSAAGLGRVHMPQLEHFVRVKRRPAQKHASQVCIIHEVSCSCSYTFRVRGFKAVDSFVHNRLPWDAHHSTRSFMFSVFQVVCNTTMCVHYSCAWIWPTSGWGSTSPKCFSSKSKLSVCRRASPWRPHAATTAS